MSKMPLICVVRLTSPKGQRTVFVEKDKFDLGRADESSVKLEFQGVSRKHLVVQIKDHEIWIEDQGSTFGTFMGEEKIPAKVSTLYLSNKALKLGNADEMVTFELAEIISGGKASVQKVSVDEKTVTSAIKVPPIPVVAPPTPAVKEYVKESEEVITLAKAEAKQWVEQTKEEIEKYKKFAESELSNAKAEAEKIKAEALTEVDKIKSEVDVQVGKIKTHAEVEAEKLINEAKDKAKELQKGLELAPLEARRIIEKGEAEAEVIRNKGHEEIKKLKENAQIEIDKLHSNAKLEIEKQLAGHKAEHDKVISDSKRDVENTLANAKSDADRIIQEAKLKSEGILKIATESSLKLKESSEDDANKIIGRAHREADEIRTKVQAEKDKLTLETQCWVDELKENTQKETSDQTRNTKEKCEKLEKEAKDKKDALIYEATLEGDRLVEAVKAKIPKLQKELESQAQESADLIVKNAHIRSAEIKVEAEKEGEVLLEKARAHADSIKGRVDADYEKVIREAKKKAGEIIEDGGEQASKFLRDARQETTKMRAKVEQEIEVLKRESSEKIEAMMTLARDESEKLIADGKAYYEKRRSSAEDEIKQKEATLLATIEEEKIRILNQAKEKVSKLDTRSSELEISVNKYEEQKKILSVELSVIHENLNKSKSECERYQSQHQELIAKLEGGDKELASIIAKIKSEQDEWEQKKNNIKSRDEASLMLQQKTEAEMMTVRDQTERMASELKKKAQQEYESRKKAEEAEIAAFKVKQIEELKLQKQLEQRHWEALQKNKIKEMAQTLEILLVGRIKQANTPGFAPVTSLNDDIQKILAQVFTEAKQSTASHQAHVTHIPEVAKHRAKRKKWTQISASLGVVVAIGLVFKMTASKDRRPASDVYSDKLKEERENKPKFNPQVRNEYRGNFTDNIIYAFSYADMKLDQAVQKRWIKELNSLFVNEMGLSENAIVKYISIEAALVGQLKDIRETIIPELENEKISKMRETEKQAMEHVKEILGSSAKVARLRLFEETFYKQYLADHQH